MSLLGIVIGLVLLIFFAIRGRSLVWAAPVCAFVVALTGGLDLLPAYTESYMTGFVGFFKSWFPTFMLSAIFGKIMETTGGAQSITKFIISKIGSRHAIFVSVLCGGVLAYGGVSGFVIIFAMYPIVLGMFREADISRRLIPAAIMAGAFTFSMSAVPGTPAIQNLIPMEYLGTTAASAPVMGMICAVIMFVGPVLWLNYRSRSLREKGLGFEEPETAAAVIPEDKLPNPLFAVIPFLAIVILLNVLHQDIVVCLLAGIILIIALNFKYLSDLGGIFNEGCQSAVSAIINTSAAVGFGSVVKLVPGFTVLTSLVLGLKGSPLLSEAIAISVLAAASGSASGGMAIALDTMAANFIQMSQASGIPLAAFHRVAALSSGALSALPHDGAIVTYLQYSGISHKDGYFDIFVVAGVFPFLATVAAVILGTIGII